MLIYPAGASQAHDTRGTLTHKYISSNFGPSRTSRSFRATREYLYTSNPGSVLKPTRVSSIPAISPLPVHGLALLVLDFPTDRTSPEGYVTGTMFMIQGPAQRYGP